MAMIRFDDWKPRVARGTTWLRALDKIDERVLEHRFYGFCTWLALHPSWRPTSADHPRPGGHPYYIAADCPICGTPLVLYDRLDERSPLADDQVWYDEWICPQRRDGAWMDWPEAEWGAQPDDTPPRPRRRASAPGAHAPSAGGSGARPMWSVF